MTPAGVTPAVYAKALADVRALRPYGTYRPNTAAPARTDPTHRSQCGSRRGYTLHSKTGERQCDQCADIEARAQRRIRATGTTVEAP